MVGALATLVVAAAAAGHGVGAAEELALAAALEMDAQRAERCGARQRRARVRGAECVRASQRQLRALALRHLELPLATAAVAARVQHPLAALLGHGARGRHRGAWHTDTFRRLLCGAAWCLAVCAASRSLH